MVNHRRLGWAIVGWLVVLAGAFFLDASFARFATTSGLVDFLKARHGVGHVVATLMKLPGEYVVTVLIAGIVAYLSQPSVRWMNGAFVLLCGLLSGINGLIKWIAGRARPFRELGEAAPTNYPNPWHFRPFYDGWHGLLFGRNLCFPSGHAMLAFATAAALAKLYPAKRWVFYALAAITAAERAMETAHWLSDCVAAAALGIGLVHLLATRLWPKINTMPAINKLADQHP